MTNALQPSSVPSRRTSLITGITGQGTVRLLEATVARGNAQCARDERGWRPQVSFQELVNIRVDHDLASAESPPDHRENR
jgi:GDP-D-mannose dehydratase